MGDGQVMNGRAIAIISVSVVFSVLAILMVVLRFVARKAKGGKYYMDDYLVVLALLLTLGVTINNIVGATVAGIGSHEVYRPSGPAAGFPFPKELKPQGQVMFALQILHTCAMPVIKASVLAFYLRLFPTADFRRAVWAVGIYVFCWWIAILFATIFQCNPISDNWGTEPSQTTGCIANINIMYETAALTNLLSDIAILVLPIPVVLGLHMLLKHKLAVICIFLTGSLVVVAGIGRTTAYFRLKYNATPDFSYWYYPLVIWTSFEPTLGVISACLPTLRPLFAGLSPESMLNSIRSVLSLRSLSRNSESRRPSPDGTTYTGTTAEGGTQPASESRQYLPGYAAKVGGEAYGANGAGGAFVSSKLGSGSRCEGGQRGEALLPDPNASRDANEVVALELRRLRARDELPKGEIVVREDVDLKVMHDLA